MGGAMIFRIPKKRSYRQVAMQRSVLELAGALALPPPPPRKVACFDANRLWLRLKQLPDRRLSGAMMKFGAWLWKSGTHDNDQVIALVEDCLRRAPNMPYAYYAKGGVARNALEARVSIDRGAAENEGYKAADRSFLEKA